MMLRSTAVVILLACGLLQVRTSFAIDCGAQPRQDESEAAIRLLEQKWSEAYWTGNAAYLECLYAPNFASADSKARLTSKAEDIASSQRNVGKAYTHDASKYEVNVAMHLHSAVATSFKGDATHGWRITDVYEYNGRHWQAIFSQTTKY
jgi:hypothetical protein